MFSCYFFPNSNQSISVPKRLFLWGYCPLDTKSWHLWILEERKSKMVLRSILKIIYCYFRVCFALPNVFWQSVFLQQFVGSKRCKRIIFGLFVLGRSCRGENVDCLNSLLNNSKQIKQHPKQLLFLTLFNCEQFIQRARQIKSLLLNACLLNMKPKMHPIGMLGFTRN